MKERRTPVLPLFWAGKTGVLRWILLIVFMAGLSSLRVYAASGNTTVSVNNMQAGDRLFFYEIASISGEGDSFAPVVLSWMQEDEATYAKFLTQGPTILNRMSQEELAYFAQRMILGLMPASAEDFALQPAGKVRADAATVSLDLPAGYYLLVIAGAKSVYTPIVFAGVQETQELTIPAKLQTAPVLEKSIGQKDAQADMGVEAAGGDILAVELTLRQTDYPAVYAPVKNTSSILEIWENGLELITSGLSIREKDGTTLTEGEDYTSQHVTDATLYDLTDSGTVAFYESGGWFYLMDGSIAGDTPQQALAEYNRLWGTSYGEQELSKRTDASLLSLNLTKWHESLQISYLLHMGNAYQPEGRYRAVTQYAYSVNPVDAQMAGETEAVVYAESFCANTTLTDGENDAQLAGGVFEVLEYADTLTGTPDRERIEQRVAALGGGGYSVLWAEGGETARIYRKVGQFITDGTGFGGLGGLRRREHLIVQTMYPQGYAISKTGLLIEPDTDWPQTEGDITRVVATQWKNYKSVKLPESGGFGTDGHTLLGMLLLLIALGMLWHRKVA